MAAGVRGEKVLLVGCTGQVALPVVNALAADNEVWGLARFNDKAAQRALESAGVRCVSLDLADPDLTYVPTDVGYVLNFAVARTGSWETDLDVNVGSVACLMEHCHTAKAFLHCSTAGVYEPQAGHAYTENDPLGDNHRPFAGLLPFLATYSISKIAAEAAVRYGAKRWNVPAIIARLNVPYGDNGGWPAFHLDLMASGTPVPLHPDRPNRFNPIHEDDIVRTLPALLNAAAVPPTVVNWAGEPSSVEEWCAELGRLTGLEPTFVETDQIIAGLPVDRTTLLGLTGPVPGVDLPDGLRRMVAARRPDLLQRSS